MVKAVIFDCFGVLVGKGFEHTYRLAGGDPAKDRVFIEDMLGQASMGLVSDDEFRTQMAAHVGISVDEWRSAVRAADLADTELLDYIKDLRKSCKTAILSNANRGVVERKIGQNWITECFDEVIVSADVGLVKPDPRIYELAVERLGVEAAECVFIDDSLGHIEGARQYGMQAVHYQDFVQMKSELTKLLG
jgi:putative hydrolase of the HAD superfamily